MTVITPEAAPSRLGFWNSVFAELVGADPHIIVRCSREMSSFRGIAILFLCVFAYQGTVLSAFAHLIYADDGRLHPVLVIVGFGLAGMIGWIDRTTVLQSSYEALGLKELQRGGIDGLGSSISAEIRTWISTIVRILLAGAIAPLAALSLEVEIMHQDIASVERHDEITINAPLTKSATLHIDAATARASDAVKQGESHVKSLQGQIATMRRVALRNDRSHVGTLRQQEAIDALAPSSRARASLPAAEQELDAAMSDLAAQRQSLADLVANREELIRHEVEASPNYMPADHGLIGQFRTLWKIASEPPNFYLIALIHAAAWLIESSAVIASLTSFAPKTYAAMLASEIYLKSVETAERLCADLADVRQGPREDDDKTETDDLPPIFTAKRDEPATNDHTDSPPPRPPNAQTDGVDSSAGETTKRPRGRPRKPKLSLVVTNPNGPAPPPGPEGR